VIYRLLERNQVTVYDLVVAMDACNYESDGYMGPLDGFVVKGSKKYHYVNMLVTVRYYYYITFAGTKFAT